MVHNDTFDQPLRQPLDLQTLGCACLAYVLLAVDEDFGYQGQEGLYIKKEVVTC